MSDFLPKVNIKPVLDQNEIPPSLVQVTPTIIPGIISQYEERNTTD